MPADESQRGALRLALGEAHRKAGDLQRAMATFQRAAAAARVLQSPEQLARAAVGFEDALLATGLPRAGAHYPSVLLQEEAQEALGGEDTALCA